MSNAAQTIDWQARAEKAEWDLEQVRKELAHEEAAASGYHSRWQRAEGLRDDAIARLERAQKQAAALQDALKSVREMISRYLVATKGRVSDSWLDGFIECGAITIDSIGYIKPVPCDTDAGANYISKEQVRPLVEALESLDNAEHSCSMERCNHCQIIEAALDHARTIGL